MPPARRLIVLLPLVVLLLALSASARAQSELVIVKEGTKEFHRPGCDVIRDGKGVLAMTRAQADARGLASHDGCDPSKVKPGPTPPAGPTPIVYVYVDDAGKLYHTEGCRRLGKNPKKVKLDDAGRKHWPCTVCKPPIRKRPR